MYKVKNGVQTAINQSSTSASWSSSNTHTSFDMFYDKTNETDIDYYLLVATDHAGNKTTKKITTQKMLLSRFHTSINRGTYEN